MFTTITIILVMQTMILVLSCQAICRVVDIVEAVVVVVGAHQEIFHQSIHDTELHTDCN